MQYIGMIYNMILVAVLVLAAAAGRRRGFAASLVYLVGSVGGVLVAVWVAQTCALAVYNDYVGASISERVGTVIAENGGDLAAALERIDFLPETLRETLSATLSNVSGDMAPQIIAALQPILLPLIQALLFLVAWVVIRALVGVLVRLLRHFNDLPILGGLNRFLGLACGLVTGAFDCWVLCVALWIVAMVTAGSISWLTTGVLNRAALYRFFASFNPFLVKY